MHADIHAHTESVKSVLSKYRFPLVCHFYENSNILNYSTQAKHFVCNKNRSSSLFKVINNLFKRKFHTLTREYHRRHIQTFRERFHWKMSSDEPKKQLLQQKLFRNLKSRQKSSTSSQDEKTSSLKTSKSVTKTKNDAGKGTETDLTKWVLSRMFATHSREFNHRKMKLSLILGEPLKRSNVRLSELQS